MEWTGQTLAEDLAKSKDQAQWLTWVQLPLGSVMWENGHTPRADVLAIRKSFVSPSFTIYEVKISRSDFLADINKGKYRAYFEHCNQLYFAVPKGLITKDEIPEGTGLTVRGDKGWRVAKAAPRREHTPNVELLLKLLMRGYEDRLVEWKQYDRLKNLEYKGLKEASYQFGIKVARDLGNASELIELANKIKDEVGKLLGIDYDSIYSAVGSLRADVDSLLAQRRYAPETMQLVTIVDRLLRGSTYFGVNVPSQLRTIADKLEAKLNVKDS